MQLKVGRKSEHLSGCFFTRHKLNPKFFRHAILHKTLRNTHREQRAGPFGPLQSDFHPPVCSPRQPPPRYLSPSGFLNRIDRFPWQKADLDTDILHGNYLLRLNCRCLWSNLPLQRTSSFSIIYYLFQNCNTLSKNYLLKSNNLQFVNNLIWFFRLWAPFVLTFCPFSAIIYSDK